MESRKEEETEVLLVDDEQQVCDFLSRALTRKGFACRTAPDSETAMREISRRLPSLVVTDLRMPGRDGHWLLGEVKRSRPELPVILLTGDGEAQTAVQCLKDGADDYLVKPVNLDELIIAVRRAAEKVRLVRETREQRTHIELVQTQRERLREAFGVIESTYRDAIGALLHAEAGRRPEDEGKPSASLTAEPVALRSSKRKMGDVEAGGSALELSGLRVAGRMIGDGAPFAQVGTAIGNEVVEREGLVRMRIWVQSEDEQVLKPLVDVGTGSVGGREQAERTLSSGEVERVDINDVISLTCPIVVNGAPRAVLQLAAPLHMGSSVGQSAERLSLVLAASLARERDARERRRTEEELDLLYELASASRYSLELEPVAEFLLGSLDKVVDYDVASLLLVDEEPSLSIQTRFPADAEFIGRVREHVLTNLKLTCGIEPPRELAVRVRSAEAPGTRPAPAKLRSFVSVPLTVGGSVAGLVYLSSGRDHAFADGEVQVIHRVANFLATSAQGVRELVAAVKGRIEQMVDHMTDGVLMLDRRGSVVAMNGAAREALNCHDEGEQAITKARLAALLDFDPIDVLRSQRRSFRKLVCVRGVPYQAQLSPVLSDGGDMVGAVLAFRNFQQEQKLDEMKTELVNVVSHELRTPLTAIKNALSLLKGKRLGELNERQDHFVELAQGNVEQLVGIINDLLDLSKLEAGKMWVDLEPLSVLEPIGAALASLEAQAEAKGISMGSSLEEGLPEVFGDAASLQRVLTNLLGNAIKFTDSGGRVSIEARKVDGETGSASGAAVRITVADSGVGIPEDQLESVFDKFHQVSGANRHTTTVGTGLGLPICRELVKAHHGRIWAESGDAAGSRFCFTLPLLSDDELLQRCLSADVARAREGGSSVGLVLLSMRGEESSRAAAEASSRRRILEELREAAKRVTRRSGDRVFLIRDKEQVAVILPGTPGEGGAVYGERLVDELCRTSVLDGSLAVNCGSSTFPEDGDSAESLYSRAQEQLAESAPA